VPEADGTIWRLIIRSPDAISLQLIFSDYVIPDGANLLFTMIQVQIFMGLLQTGICLPTALLPLLILKAAALHWSILNLMISLRPANWLLGW
jgi:hypothetical protein